jgi:AraC family transcriptional regulator
MQPKLPLRIDATQPEKLKAALPQPLILSSQLAGWRGIGLAYHCQSNYELPETCPAQHIISIYTRNFCANLMLNGRWQRLSYARNEVGIFPADQISPAVQFMGELGFIHIYLDPTLLTKVAHEFVDSNRLEIVQQLQTHDPLIEQLGFTLKQELECSESDSYLYAESTANLLAVHLLKRYSIRKVRFPNYSGGLPKARLREITTYIHIHLDQMLSLAELAAVVGMSPHYFATLFKQSTGLAPHQYITECRIQRAKQLLTQADLSILQVSFAVGFQSQSHFAKVFRKHTGVTPQGYRQAL